MNQHSYTAEDDAVIIGCYGIETLHRIAEKLGRTFHSVQQRTYVLIGQGRLRMSDRFYHRPWTEDDEEYLADHWGRIGDAAIAKHLGRTIVSIRLKAKRLGLTRRGNVWTAADVARLFGVNGKTVVHWIERGWLRGHRAPFGAGGRDRAWSIDEDSLGKFIRTMGWAYDVRMMTPGEYLTNLARQIHRADPWLETEGAARLAGVAVNTIQRWCRGGLPHHRRGNLGSQHGPWQGKIIIRRSDLLTWVDERKRRAHENRSRAAKERCAWRPRQRVA